MSVHGRVAPIIITGLSGAGISSVLKALEDFRFEVFDNFPLSLIPSLYGQVLTDSKERKSPLAIGVDTRTRGFSPKAVMKVVDEIGARLVFITCDDAVLQKRFTETRRRHPFAQDRSVAYGIDKERVLLRPLRDKADLVIDSTDISIHDLRHILEGHFVLQPNENLMVSLVSFGFRHGIPREADLVMDVRFLRNPHWDTALRPMSGLDTDVGEYIRQDKDFEGFVAHFKALLQPLFPRYVEEGKSYLTIGIGCTGGRHRSVFTVETMKVWLEGQGMSVHVTHRDL